MDKLSEPLTNANAKVRGEGRCRTCPTTENLTKHHLVPEHWFKKHPGVPGRHSSANLVPLCIYCHAVLEGQLAFETARGPRALEKRRTLRAALLQSELRFVVRTRGRPWLDHHYPVATTTHAL